jgi:Domain of unknown function (DUF4430)
MKKIAAIIVILILIVAGIVVFHPVANVSQNSATIHPTAVLKQTKAATIIYKGQDGIDALTLLKKQATVTQDHSGLVDSINGYKPTGHNYWAFYVNGKMAQVGPADYKTKDTDTIMWKVEKY